MEHKKMIYGCQCSTKELTNDDMIEVAEMIRKMDKRYTVTIQKDDLIDVRVKQIHLQYLNLAWLQYQQYEYRLHVINLH